MLHPRQTYTYNDGNDGWWYYSETAFIIKWVITGVILVGLALFFLGGYLHAQRRMKRGLPPLRYHRWMLTKKQRARFLPPEPAVYYHRGPLGYHGPAVPLQSYGPAPPAYGDQGYLPPYTPPSKVNPDQSFQTTEAGQHPGPSQPAPVAGVYR